MARARPAPGRLARGALAVALGAGGLACDFFRELESDPEATSDGDDPATAGSEDGADACTVLDDHCGAQDRLEACLGEPPSLTSIDCAAVCAPLLNVTCLRVPEGLHGCWCAQPGGAKNLACGELEQCLAKCSPDPASPCIAQCFSRTTASTARLFGALVHCAQAACAEVCRDQPGGCGPCTNAAMAGLYGGCTVQRSVCDDDRTDEFPWP